MREFRFRIILILAFFALSVYLLFPTYADLQNTKSMKEEVSLYRQTILTANPEIDNAELESILTLKEDSIRVSDPTIRENREKRVKL